MDVEIDADADSHDEDHGRSSAQLNAEQSEDTKELDDDGSQNESAQSGRPNAHESHAKDEEDGHQDASQRQEQEEAQLQILLPEGEWDSGWKVGQAPIFKLLTDTPHL